jgi:hypothetical protein
MRYFRILYPFLAHILKTIWYNEGEGKNGSFIFIFSRNSVSNHIFFSFLVNDIIIITKEFSYPFLLLWEGRSLLQKIPEALMICLNLEPFPKEIRALEIHGMHNSQHFLFIDLLAQIAFRQFFSSKGKRSSLLHKDNYNSSSRGITFEEKGFGEIRKGQDQSSTHSYLQILKILIYYEIPSERIIFKESSERGHNLPIIMNKLAIIVG